MPRYQTYGQYDAKNDEFPDSAEKVLRAGEDAAAGFEGDLERPEDRAADSANEAGRSTAREANEREGFYSGDGLARALNGARGKSKGGSFFKKRAPLIAIVMLISGMGVGIGLSQALMPFHIVETFTEMTDTAFASRAVRMPKLVRYVFNLEGSDYAETTSNLLGGKTTRFRRNITSKNVINRLEAEGITVNKASGAGETTLTYHSANGDIEVTAERYQQLYEEDAEFRNRMNRGGRGFLGRIAAHIDLTLANFLNSHNLTKNLFHNWIEKVYNAEGQSLRLHETIEARKPAGAGDVDVGTARTDGTAVDENGTSTTKLNKNVDTDTLKTNYGEALAKIASATTSAVCGTAAVASMVSAAKLAIAYNNSRLNWSGYAETQDKTRAGYGEEAPMYAENERLLLTDENGKTAMDAEGMKWAVSGGNYKINPEAEDVALVSANAIKKDSSFLSSIAEFFGLSLNGTFLGDVGMSTKWIIGCAVANIATATISVIVDIMTVGTFSVGKVVISTALGAAGSMAFSKLAEMLVQNAKSDFCNDTDAIGPKLGACMYLGASNYNGINAQNGGATLVTESKARESYRNYQIALADEAELIRSTKSPFDASTTHTFLGSIMSQFSSLAIAMPSVASFATTLTNLTSTAVMGLLPTASALDETLAFENGMKVDCSNLEFGDNLIAVGFADCESWFTTDQSINDIDPEYAFTFLANYVDTNGESQFIKENGQLVLDENGNEQINPASTLGKYVSYCTYRSSPFGQVDQNIMNAEADLIKQSSGDGKVVGTLKQTLNSILNALPLIGSAVDMFTAEKQIATLGWSTGANCVAREGDADTELKVTVGMNADGEYGLGSLTYTIDLISWEKFMKYAQSYVTDARYMETMGDPDYVSPVLAYAQEIGLLRSDDELSLVEYLAKYTGYTEENMQIALNEVEYWSYIAQYDPDGKGPMKFEDETFEIYDFSQPEVMEENAEYIASQRVVYFDERNRVIAVA